MDEDWNRALAIVAHPDDMEYGSAAAVARWTAQGKHVAYVLVSSGEAGIKSMSPSEAGPLRQAEQVASCAVVGVTDVAFLDRPDGLIVNDLALRRDLASAIRRVRPELVITLNHHDSWGPGSWNHPDHQAVGSAILDCIMEAGNPWLHSDQPFEAWDGVKMVAVGSSTSSTHGVDTTETLDAGVDSLKCHAAYLAALDGNDPDDLDASTAFLREAAAAAGEQLGTNAASLFEIIHF